MRRAEDSVVRVDERSQVNVARKNKKSRKKFSKGGVEESRRAQHG
jgi:hypothetical protein